MGGKRILNSIRKQLTIFILVLLVTTLNGCALLKVPFTIAGESLKLVGKVLQVVDKLPKPPWWVF